MRTPRRQPVPACAFTLLEMLVSFSILLFIMLCVSSLVQMLRDSSRTVNSNITAFESAGTAFETMSRLIRQATLQSFIDYNHPTHPTSYLVRSHLHFICGSSDDLGLTFTGAPDSSAIFFQAPLGLAQENQLRPNNALLNSAGFYIAYGGQPLRPPSIEQRIPDRMRYRLFLFFPPREEMGVYSRTLALTTSGFPISEESYQGTDWFALPIERREHAHCLAENVVALIISPVDQDGGGSFAWNSRSPGPFQHRLPHRIRMVMAVIDEPSAIRLEEAGSTALPLLPAGFLAPSTPPAPDEFEAKLQALETLLMQHPLKLRYRIFRADIPLTPSSF